MTSVRQLTEEDFAIFRAIRLEALHEHPHAYGGSYEEESLRGDEEWVHLLRDTAVFAYFDGEEAVGVAGYFIAKGIKRCHRATIFTVYVKEGYRGRGITDWLLNAIAYHARDMGVELLHLAVGTYNQAAQSCYERNGFTRYATEERSLKVNGDYIDEHQMVKYLL